MALKIKRILLYALVLSLCFIAIIYSRQIAGGVISGMSSCINIIIPSLFPFMVLSSFIALSPLNSIISKPIAFFTKKILKLPQQMGSVILMSLIGGYPVGAKTLSTMLKNKSINERTVEKMLCYCVNAGPSFVISAVGVAMFSNFQVGVIIFLSQIITTLLIAIFTAYFDNENIEISEYKEHSFCYNVAFVKSVINSAEAMLVICAFVIIFSAIIAMLQYSGILDIFCRFLTSLFCFTKIDENFYKCIICGILEVTSGCIASTRINGNISLLLCSSFISFGGLSVIFQVMSCFNGYKINFKPFLASRFANCFLSALVSYMLGINKFVFSIKSNALFDIPVANYNNNSYLLLIFMFLLSSIMLLSLKFKGENLKKCRFIQDKLLK